MRGTGLQRKHQVAVGGPPGTVPSGRLLGTTEPTSGQVPEGVADYTPVQLYARQVKLLQPGLNALC